jgi:hypothetical protein
MKCIGLDKNDTPLFSNKKLFNFCYKALKNYIKFRLSLMQDETVQNIEKEILEAGVKAGIKYAESKFGVDIPEQGEEQIQQIAVDVARLIIERRIGLFLFGLGYATHKLGEDSTCNEKNT